MARKQRPLKTHLFEDCPNMFPNGDDAPRSDRIENTTCGACKRRVLNRIADSDWSAIAKADPELALILQIEAEIARKV